MWTVFGFLLLVYLPRSGVDWIYFTRTSNPHFGIHFAKTFELLTFRVRVTVFTTTITTIFGWTTHILLRFTWYSKYTHLRVAAVHDEKPSCVKHERKLFFFFFIRLINTCTYRTLSEWAGVVTQFFTRLKLLSRAGGSAAAAAGPCKTPYRKNFHVPFAPLPPRRDPVDRRLNDLLRAPWKRAQRAPRCAKR